MLKADFAFVHQQGLGIGLVEDGLRLGKRAHAVGHGADILKQAGGFPHDVLREPVHAQRHGGGGGHGAHAHLAVVPQPNAEHGGGKGERGIYCGAGAVEQRGQPHLGVHGYHKFFHRAAGIIGFARTVGEEFHGGDVGVGIGNAAGHQRTGIGLASGGLAEPGNQKTHHQTEADEPAHERQQQPAIQRHQNHAGSDEIHQHIHHHIGDSHHRIAHGQRGLHHFGRHAAGKLVLIKAERLAEHQAVEIPAQAHGEHALQYLQADGGSKKRPNHQHHHQHAHADERQAFFGKQRFRRIAAEPIDDFADELKQ